MTSRILHLVEPGAPEGGVGALLSASVAVSYAEGRHAVVVIGTRRDVAMASAFGLSVAAAACPARGFGASIGAFRRALRSQGRADVIHAWSARGAMLAAAAAPRATRVLTLPGPPAARVAEALRPVAASCRVTALGTATASLARRNGLGAKPLPPGVPPVRADARHRAAIRASWDVDERTFVLGLVGDPVARADALVAATTVARLRLAGRRALAVVHPDSARRLDAQRWLRPMGYDGMLVLDERLARPSSVAAGLDAALQVAHGARPPSLPPLLELMSAGAAVVAMDDPLSREALSGGRAGILGDPADPENAAAGAMLRLLDHPAARRELAEAAVLHATRSATPSKLGDELTGMYQGGAAARQEL